MSPNPEIIIRVLPALVVTVPFGVAGYLLGGVTRSGAVAGTACAFAIFVGLGWGGFVTLAGVFAITWIATRLGSREKIKLGLAHDRSGRNAGQVLANVGAAALLAVASPFWTALAVAAVAAMAEAAADTTQSEIGELSSAQPRMITSLRPVPTGTDGGVSCPGLIAGFVAAAIVTILAEFGRVLTPHDAWVAGTAGFLGSLIDSLLGATFERAGWLNNNSVNLLSTFSGAAIALALSQLRH